MDDYRELHQLEAGTLVEDAHGQVWLVTKPQSTPGETWLCPFSDEYAFSIMEDGSTYALGDQAPLPIYELLDRVT